LSVRGTRNAIAPKVQDKFIGALVLARKHYHSQAVVIRRAALERSATEARAKCLLKLTADVN
jgi:hypothetical protein